MELGADPAQRPVRLGGQQQHDQRGLEVEATGGQPQPDEHGDQRDRQRRDQLEHRRRGERDLERRQGGVAVARGDHPDPVALQRGPVVGDERGKTADQVDEVAGQRGQQPPLAVRPVPGGQADEHGEHRDQRQRHRRGQRSRPVDPRHGEQRRGRQHHGHHEGGQVAGQVGLDGRDAPGQQHGELAGAVPRRAAAQRERGLAEPSAQRRTDLAGRAGRRTVGQPAGGRTGRERREHPRAGPRQVLAADSRGDQAGEREGLRDQQQAAGGAAGHHPGQRPPRRPEVRKDPRVDGLHQAGMCWTPMRRRNTQ